jgi:hypothetical protein
MCEVMEQQGEDPRALFFLWRVDGANMALLARAAELGYAPAQAELSFESRGRECFKWASLAAENGDRGGLCELGICYRDGLSCTAGPEKGIELFREAAHLGSRAAQRMYGELAYGERDWQRYHWWARSWRHLLTTPMCLAMSALLPLFEQGQHSRIVHEVAPVIRRNLEANLADGFIEEGTAQELRRVLKVHDAMTSRAKEAVACWSMCALRLGVMKDMRVVIAKLVWAEPWRWSGI